MLRQIMELASGISAIAGRPFYLVQGDFWAKTRLPLLNDRPVSWRAVGLLLQPWMCNR